MGTGIAGEAAARAAPGRSGEETEVSHVGPWKSNGVSTTTRERHQELVLVAWASRLSVTSNPTSRYCTLHPLGFAPRSPCSRSGIGLALDQAGHHFKQRNPDQRVVAGIHAGTRAASELPLPSKGQGGDVEAGSCVAVTRPGRGRSEGGRAQAARFEKDVMCRSSCGLAREGAFGHETVTQTVRRGRNLGSGGPHKVTHTLPRARPLIEHPC